MNGKPQLSIVIPVYNEEENLRLLWTELQEVLKSLPSAEVIFVDDGSKDRSFEFLKELQQEDSRIKIISFKKNYGQTAAMSAGITESRGEIIVPMDADLQNDPNEIGKLLQKLNEGHDVVSGWRKNRHDGFLRVLFSRAANNLIGMISGVRIHDYGCTMKAYRRDVIASIDLVGEVHRFIPVYASWYGARVTEMEVNHRPRQFGVSKYGFSRVFKVLLDLLVAKFMLQYASRPIHFFGMLGIFSWILGFLSFLFAVWLRFALGISFIETPMLLLTVLLFLTGLQLISIGLLADMILRTRGERQQMYSISEVIGRDS